MQFGGVLGGEWGAAPCWWNWELQLCRGAGWEMGVLPPGGGGWELQLCGVRGGEWGCCPLVAGLGIAAMLG